MSGAIGRTGEAEPQQVEALPSPVGRTGTTGASPEVAEAQPSPVGRTGTTGASQEAQPSPVGTTGASQQVVQAQPSPEAVPAAAAPNSQASLPSTNVAAAGPKPPFYNQESVSVLVSDMTYTDGLLQGVMTINGQSYSVHSNQPPQLISPRSGGEMKPKKKQRTRKRDFSHMLDTLMKQESI